MLKALSLGILGRKARGFTLIELLVVIGIIAILAAIVLIAVNPARQFAQSRNTQRESDVRAILDGIHQYAADNDGNLPAVLTATPTDVGTAGLNLVTVLVPTYVSAMPTDPSGGSEAATLYVASVDTTTGRVTVTASNPELGKTISITR